MRFFVILFILLSIFLEAREVLAVVNGYEISDEVAPKNFKKLSKDEQKRIVNRLIERFLAADYALKSDVVRSKEFKKVYSHIIGYSKENNSSDIKTLSDLVNKNESQGYTKEQLRSKKGLLAFDFLVAQKAESIKPTQEELKEYYKATKYKYDTPHMVEISTIVLDTKEAAEEVYKKLKSNKKVTFNKFFEMAQKYSKAPDAVDGGYLGKIAVNELNSVIKDDILKLKRGEFTKPIKTEFGFQIYYLINNIPEVKTTFDMVKDRVKDEYIQMKVKKWAFSLIKDLKSKAKIEIKLK